MLKNDKIPLTSKIKKNINDNNLYPITSQSQKKNNETTSKYIESFVFWQVMTIF